MTDRPTHQRPAAGSAVERIDHIVLRCARRQRAIRLYRQVLGCKVRHASRSWAPWCMRAGAS